MGAHWTYLNLIDEQLDEMLLEQHLHLVTFQAIIENQDIRYQPNGIWLEDLVGRVHDDPLEERVPLGQQLPQCLIGPSNLIGKKESYFAWLSMRSRKFS